MQNKSPHDRSDQVTKKERGRTIKLSAPRRIMCDVLAAAQKIPTVPVQRIMNVGRLVEARGQLGGAADVPGWCAIFTKAYGITAERFPELRRAYLSFPWARLYEHPFSIASIAVERQHQGENAVFWGHLQRPEHKPLVKLQSQLRNFKEAPLESLVQFHRALKIGRLPGVLRRFALWLGLSVFGRKRASFMGTFGVSVYSGLGAESLHPISPLTGTLNYGVIGPDGTVSVRLVYDHRVLDGATVARALACMEQVLNSEILDELHQAPIAKAA